MIKRTLYFGNPAYLSLKDNQLVAERRIGSTEDEAAEEGKPVVMRVPIEDIGTILLDHPMITITQPVLREMISHNVAVVSCDEPHMPNGMFLPLAGSGVQPERFRYQLRATKPLRKQLWAQTMQSKILNQAALLELTRDVPPGNTRPQSFAEITEIRFENMRKWAGDLRSGDPTNLEGRAAAFYWGNLFRSLTKHPLAQEFRRDRMGLPPNNLLNYGYAVLRAMTAQALVASGLLPTQGIHHSNKYNAYPLADDIMEPYRPYVDAIVFEIVKNGEDYEVLTKSIKQQLLSLAAVDVIMNGKRRPLHIAMQRTTSSLAFCFLGERRRILYPELGGHTEEADTQNTIAPNSP
jgi:CRISPR-associated protein Cas1